jgi:hypothetical protein
MSNRGKTKARRSPLPVQQSTAQGSGSSNPDDNEALDFAIYAYEATTRVPTNTSRSSGRANPCPWSIRSDRLDPIGVSISAFIVRHRCFIPYVTSTADDERFRDVFPWSCGAVIPPKQRGYRQ